MDNASKCLLKHAPSLSNHIAVPRHERVIPLPSSQSLKIHPAEPAPNAMSPHLPNYTPSPSCRPPYCAQEYQHYLKPLIRHPSLPPLPTSFHCELQTLPPPSIMPVDASNREAKKEMLTSASLQISTAAAPAGCPLSPRHAPLCGRPSGRGLLAMPSSFPS